MIYHLFKYFYEAGIDFPGSQLLLFPAVRLIAASVTAIIIALFAGNKIIKLLQRKQIGETIRDLGLEGQMQKKGTPTMGGVIILISVIIPVLLFCDLTSTYTLLLLLATVWCGGIGFADDYIKVFKHNKEGMSEKGKLILQFGLALIVALVMCFSPDMWAASADGTKQLVTTVPFVKNNGFDYSWLSPFSGQVGMYFTWGIYVVMIIFVILACSNGVNLTDGMDGLAAGTTAIVGVVIGILAWIGGDIQHASYLNIMPIHGSGEVAIYMGALVGALLGFLWYNSFPAQVFMGDTGSLALGGIVGVSAILIRKELLLPLMGGIFLVESLSVLMQRGYFKYTKKKYGEGRRIFKMSPLHHHFQKEGIPALISKPVHAHPEAKIVSRFWLVGIILGILTLALLKIQ